MKIRTTVHLGDALDLSFVPDSSVDLVVTSPPYFGQRIYLDDDGNPITHAVGSEATPTEYLNALSVFMGEMWRVIKPTGSVFVNLGDKYAGSGGHNNASIQGTAYDAERPTRDGPSRYVKVTEVRRKSLLGLPWRFALQSIDAGWILRQELVWDKPNGMPESVTDRTRRSHEQWFHFVKEEIYFAALDDLREPVHYEGDDRQARGPRVKARVQVSGHDEGNTSNNHLLGKLPSSVQRISTGGLRPTAAEKARFNLPDHFAPYPAEWPRFFILGWSPVAWCDICREPVRPIVEKTKMEWTPSPDGQEILESGAFPSGKDGTTLRGTMTSPPTAQIIGYSCGSHASIPPDFLSDPPSSWSPSLILDPFAGTGTTSLVARLFSRSSIAVDISPAYIRLMNWRLYVSDHNLKLSRKWTKKGLL